MFVSLYNNFEGKSLNIVMPNVTMFSNTYLYPNKSKVRSGPDYLAALYLSEALNFNFQ